MATELKRNVDVQEPVFCLDDQQQSIEGTAMYEWMSVRAAGPNIMKDTTLCGTTTILGPVDVCQPPMEMLNPQPFLQDIANPQYQILNIDPPNSMCIFNGQNQSNTPGVDLIMPVSSLNIAETAGTSASGSPNANWVLAAEFVFDVDCSVLTPLPYTDIPPVAPAAGEAYRVAWTVNPYINRYYQAQNAFQVESDAVYVDILNMLPSGTPAPGQFTDYTAPGECYAVSVTDASALFDSNTGELNCQVLLYDPSSVVSSGNVNYLRLSCGFTMIMNVNCSIPAPP